MVILQPLSVDRGLCHALSLLLLLLLCLPSQNWALISIEPSCAPFRSVVEEAVEEAQAMAHKAYSRLVAGSRDEDATHLYRVLFGNEVGRYDRIGR